MLHSILGRTLLVAVALTQTNAEHPHEHDKEECACAQHETDHPFRLCLDLSFGGAQRSHDWCNCNGILHPLNQRARQRLPSVCAPCTKPDLEEKDILGREKESVLCRGHCNTLVRY